MEGNQNAGERGSFVKIVTKRKENGKFLNQKRPRFRYIREENGPRVHPVSITYETFCQKRGRS